MIDTFCLQLIYHSYLLSFYLPSDMNVESAIIGNDKIELYVKSILDYGICPYCGHRSEKIRHSFQTKKILLPK